MEGEIGEKRGSMNGGGDKGKKRKDEWRGR